MTMDAKNKAAAQSVLTTNSNKKLFPRADDLFPYVRAGLQLIPLHKWNAVDSKGRPRGKTPRDGAWQANDYDSNAVIDTVRKQGINAGVRLTSSIMVLDVDPRNFGGQDDPDNAKNVDRLAELVRDTDLDLSLAPHTITGSGGHHYWFKKPADVSLMDSLQDYPGIEFKSFGRQVVATGSVHPGGQKEVDPEKADYYRWDDFAPDLEDMPDIPQVLLNLIRRPTRAHGDAFGGGELTPEMLAETLEQIDAADYADQSTWLNIMMASHHATHGEGRQEFIDWSTNDPEYADHAWVIGRRWDSLHLETGRGNRPVTIKFLHKLVQEAGFEVARSAPEDDFDEFTTGEIAEFDRLSLEQKSQPKLIKRGKKIKNSFPECLKAIRNMNRRLGLVYDQFKGVYELTHPDLPWSESLGVGRRLNDEIIRQVRQILVERTHLNWMPNDISEAMMTVAMDNSVHPVREYLSRVQWDGVNRLDQLLPTYVGAVDTPYTRAVGAKAMIAAVRRVREPGCKFDNVIVLEGTQGSGKSSFVRSLTPNVDWFSDSPIGNTENKDAPLALQGNWIIELGEMSVLNKSGVEALKAFVSSGSDNVRRPYSRHHEVLKRQCIFIGTTNHDSYLKDQTGNRRFWPVKVGTIKLEEFLADRDQLWAEAATREAAGESLILPAELWQTAAVEQESRVSDDPWIDILRNYLDGLVGETDRIHTGELLTFALHIPPAKQTSLESQRLRMVMEKHLGWKHKNNLRAGEPGKQGKGYQRE